MEYFHFISFIYIACFENIFRIVISTEKIPPPHTKPENELPEEIQGALQKPR